MNNKENKPIKAIISGGGTGGHIFPAVSIATKLKEKHPDCEILFVGAEGKMEMEKVPAAGFKIIGLPAVGLQRRLTWHNFKNNIQIPFKILRSLHIAKKIIKDFKPDIAIGVGGYASAPLLKKAQSANIPTLIQEQNSYAGLTNKILGKKAKKICVAYPKMERFFPAERIVMTGNPIRKGICPATESTKAKAFEFYNLNPNKKHILITGGSLGSRTLNEAMEKWIMDGCLGGNDIEIMWQCGKFYKNRTDAFMATHKCTSKVKHYDFIKDMDLAYAAADIVISRSGASSISELCAAHKAVIFVPSPNVSEDHQTHNAMALVRNKAAMMVKDKDAVNELLHTALDLIHDGDKIEILENNAGKMAIPDAADRIVKEIETLLKI